MAILRDTLSTCSVFFQTDGDGHQSQEVSLLSKYCPIQNKIVQVWAGLNSVTGKVSLQVALGVKKILGTILSPGFIRCRNTIQNGWNLFG